MSTDLPPLPIPRSILDTDLYKLTMQQAVLRHFPGVTAKYQFANRSHDTKFSFQCVERFRAAISHFADLTLTQAEKDWLAATCPYLTEDYINYLSSYRFKPDQVDVKFVATSKTAGFGDISIEIEGPWPEAILWEVPLLACLSETYFQVVNTDWDYIDQEDLAFQKGKAILEAGCVFSEFGTRRRRSYATQEIVMQGLLRASNQILTGGTFSGTSNVYLAHKYNVAPVGTVAHEWFMAVAALRGYQNANSTAMALWEEVYYPGATLIALTDTFSSECFFRELTKEPDRMQRWHGIRQDSGDPLSFGPRARRFYESLGIDPAEKTLVYSDALDVDKVLQLAAQCNALGFKRAVFGVGTFLTNDFWSTSSGHAMKSKALNIVIKLSRVDELPCIKLSDDLTKSSGDKKTIDHAKRTLAVTA